MTSPTLASDVPVLAAGAATLTAVAIAAKNPPFKTSLETEREEDPLCDPLCAPLPEKESSFDELQPEEGEEDEEEPQVEEKPILSLGDIEKKVVTSVTVEEVPLTPGSGAAEIEVGRRVVFEVNCGAMDT